MDVKALLNQITQISQKYDEIRKNTGRNFNIFSIAGIETDERKICRIINELVAPKGCHCQGAVYLDLFMKHVLKIKDFEIEELEKAVVEREKYIEDKRRIDLFINIPGKMKIPIEAKVNAGDMSLQCYDYYKYALNSNLYYLTLDRHGPSEESVQDLDRENITCISFGEEILEWLSECLKLPETIRLAPIREIILQFTDLLRKLTNQVEDKMEQEILELIMKSEESFRSAELIPGMLKTAEQKICDKFFRALDKKIRESYPKLEEKWLELSGNAEYDQQGIFYFIKELEDRNSIYLEVIVDDNKLCAGFKVYNVYDGNVKVEEWSDHIDKREDILIGSFENDTDERWIIRKFFENKTDECPKFKQHNDAFYKLLNPCGLEDFVEESMHTIDELMGSLKEEYRVE